MRAVLGAACFLSAVGTAFAASPDVLGTPTAPALERARSIGWTAAATELEEALARDWKPSHVAQAGSAGRETFRHWLLLARWFRLLGTPEPQLLKDFLGRRVLEDPERGNALVVIPPGLPLPTDQTGRPLPTAREKLEGAAIPAEIMQTFLPQDYSLQQGETAGRAKEDFLLAMAADPGFLRDFFRLLTPDDFAPAVIMRLGQLHAAYPHKWNEYRNLMLATALVYDQREPSFWPHHQVEPGAVPRMTESPVERCGYLIRENESGKLANDLRRMSADHVTFVVDAPVSSGELAWAARHVRVPRDQFDRVFTSINYDHRRAQKGEFIWPHSSYALRNIQLWGGICTDQAYFASIAGKARGIPTIYFAGQGNDGGHAWFGFLRGNGRWEMDAGRDQNQNYTVGRALDPQTWLPISDHDLLYISGRALRTEGHEAALSDLAMAEIFEARGDAGRALAAAESALFLSPGHVNGWETREKLLASSEDTEPLRAHYRSAIDQFRRDEDLRVRYQARLADLERQGGDAKLAGKLEARMVRENRRERADLSAATGATALARRLEEGDFEGAAREYRGLLRGLGRRGGGNLFYQVVRPYVQELRAAGRGQEASRALRDARRAMDFSGDSILAREFAELEAAGKDAN
jgi:tetratricopeptide (TPR) repeat protein